MIKHEGMKKWKQRRVKGMTENGRRRKKKRREEEIENKKEWEWNGERIYITKKCNKDGQDDSEKRKRIKERRKDRMTEKKTIVKLNKDRQGREGRTDERERKKK